jgi:GntR family transcriptional regulator / MocR family aminotransferase
MCMNFPTVARHPAMAVGGRSFSRRVAQCKGVLMSRAVRTSELMWLRLFRRFDGRSGTLQGQLRDMLVHAVMEGFLAPGAALPASRVLARTLALSRTTVTLSLQALADRGLLVSRPRSGYFVADALQQPLSATSQQAGGPSAAGATDWRRRLQLQPSAQRNIEKPLDWQQQPYPFIYGQFDATLFPFRDWRACTLESLQARSVRQWATDLIDRDDDALVDEIHRRLLPARGIWADRDEILVTNGAQQATFLLAMLLVGPATRVGIEDPGYPDARNNFALRTRHVRALPVDAGGLVLGRSVARCDFVYVTPSHQCPTTVTMPLERRRELLEMAGRADFVVIEDDHESELNFTGQSTPALKSLDTAQRVIYVGSLSKTLVHGLRLGYLVAPAALVRELRALRRLMVRHVATNNQQTAARFIAHGHHEAYVRRLNLNYRERARVLLQAIATHATQLQPTVAQGGSALWVSAPSGVDTAVLGRTLYQRGVVVEPGAVFYARPGGLCNQMRIGYSSIAVDSIEAGVREIARALKDR